ncbi:Growth factor receptor cysteine-rich domain [Trinorchestia longiramus]|nr:Growth factor receptor cysteine-rich domain [Trinorchestia longiramus]
MHLYQQPTVCLTELQHLHHNCNIRTLQQQFSITKTSISVTGMESATKDDISECHTKGSEVYSRCQSVAVNGKWSNKFPRNSRMFQITKILFALLVITELCKSTDGFRRDCTNVTCPLIKCPFGSTFSYFYCCNVCNKREGDPCGGLWVQDGYCAEGLTCVIQNPEDPSSVGVCQDEFTLNSTKG